MVPDRELANIESPPDIFVRQALRKQLKYLHFARAQTRAMIALGEPICNPLGEMSTAGMNGVDGRDEE